MKNLLSSPVWLRNSWRLIRLCDSDRVSLYLRNSSSLFVFNVWIWFFRSVLSVSFIIIRLERFPTVKIFIKFSFSNHISYSSIVKVSGKLLSCIWFFWIVSKFVCCISSCSFNTWFSSSTKRAWCLILFLKRKTNIILISFFRF